MPAIYDAIRGEASLRVRDAGGEIVTITGIDDVGGFLPYFHDMVWQ